MEHRSPPGWLTLGLPPKMPPHRRASAFDGLGHIPLHVSRRALALRRGGGRVTACRVHAGWVSGRPRPPPISRSSPTSGRRGGGWPCRPRSPLRGRLGDRCRGRPPLRFRAGCRRPFRTRWTRGHRRRRQRGIRGVSSGSRWPLEDSLASTAVYRTGCPARTERSGWEHSSGPCANNLREMGLGSAVAADRRRRQSLARPGRTIRVRLPTGPRGDADLLLRSPGCAASAALPGSG